jgi:hypothetical protein
MACSLAVDVCRRLAVATKSVWRASDYCAVLYTVAGIVALLHARYDYRLWRLDRGRWRLLITERITMKMMKMGLELFGDVV